MKCSCSKTKSIIGTLAGIAFVYATVQDIKHQGLFYKALPKALQQGLDDLCKK